LGIFEERKFREIRQLIRNPEFCALPTCCEKELKGYVTHVINCGKFYFVPQVSNGPDFKQPEMRHNIVYRRIKEIIEQTELKVLKSTSEATIGDIVIANYGGEKVRGLVKKIEKDCNMMKVKNYLNFNFKSF
jgi:hypothetical protein